MVNDLQRRIMELISDWTSSNDIPIQRSYVIKELVKQDVKNFTVINSLNSLLKKGFIRKSTNRSNKTSYIQIRTI